MAGGSILGDKTRMEHLSRDPSAFIRPSPAGSLGRCGAQNASLCCFAKRQVLMWCWSRLCVPVRAPGGKHGGFFLILLLPGWWRRVTRNKEGHLELADAIMINKADGESEVWRVKPASLPSAMSLLASNDFWKPEVTPAQHLSGRASRIAGL